MGNMLMIAEKQAVNQTKLVATVVEEVLRTKASRVIKLKDGKSHNVYLVSTGKGQFVIKAFRQKTIFSDADLPDHEKLLWISQQLTADGIPNQEIIDFQATHPLLPAGYIIYKYIPGMNAKVLIDKKKLSEPEYFSMLGALLRKIHRITLPNYGSIDQRRESFDNFSEWKSQDCIHGLKQMESGTGFGQKEYTKIQNRVHSLSKMEKKFSPVLVHGDPWPVNCVLNKKQGLVLIDWDEAWSAIWLTDLASVTYVSKVLANDDNRMKAKIDWFLNGYGETNLSKQEILAGIRSLHILNCVKLMAYHYFHTRNLTEFKLCVRKILSLI